MMLYIQWKPQSLTEPVDNKKEGVLVLPDAIVFISISCISYYSSALWKAHTTGTKIEFRAYAQCYNVTMKTHKFTLILG